MTQWITANPICFTILAFPIIVTFCVSLLGILGVSWRIR